MAYNITFSPEAQEELREIALYIQEYDPDKAIPFVDDIIDHFENTLGQFPESGILYLRGIRKLPYKKYTAFYVVDEAHLEVEIIHLIDLAKPLEARDVQL